VSLCQLWQVLVVAELALVVEASAAVILAVAAAAVALLVAALGPHQLSTAVAFEEHQSPGVHTLPGEVLADQMPDLGSIMVAIACLRCGRRDSVAQSVDPQDRTWAGPLQLLGNQTA
jgi:hypothetical protein